MSSVNPVFVLPGALEERGSDIAEEFFHSCTLGVGQFCTCPGILIVPTGATGDAFVETCTNSFTAADPGILLSSSDHISSAITTFTGAGAEVLAGGSPIDGDGFVYASTLLAASAGAFLEDPASLQTEAFGPVSLIMRADGLEEMPLAARALEGTLTGTIYTDANNVDQDAYRTLEPELRMRVGRLVANKMPTGVAVSPAMNHGGPYPSTGHPGFTAVGIPASIHRFAALHSYDNVPREWLPLELQNRNPNGSMFRLIDGAWSQDDVT